MISKKDLWDNKYNWMEGNIIYDFVSFGGCNKICEIFTGDNNKLIIVTIIIDCIPN